MQDDLVVSGGFEGPSSTFLVGAAGVGDDAHAKEDDEEQGNTHVGSFHFVAFLEGIHDGRLAAVRPGFFRRVSVAREVHHPRLNLRKKLATLVGILLKEVFSNPAGTAFDSFGNQMFPGKNFGEVYFIDGLQPLDGADLCGFRSLFGCVSADDVLRQGDVRVGVGYEVLLTALRVDHLDEVGRQDHGRRLQRARRHDV